MDPLRPLRRTYSLPAATANCPIRVVAAGRRTASACWDARCSTRRGCGSSLLRGDGDRVELEAPLFLREETYVTPFAMRALGIARGDRALIEQAIERFARCNLSWHASQTRTLEF